MSQTVLCINAGSSSLKVTLFATLRDEPEPLARLTIEDVASSDAALASALTQLAAYPTPTLVVHRIVHGGPDLTAPVLVTPAIVAALEATVPLAPLHAPASLAGIAAVAARLPGVPQVACFDTAFHARMPSRAQRIPLPDAFGREGVRRYGFHGLSYEYIVSALAPSVPRRLVIAHLGNGASLVAVERGQSIDTTMGLTPTGGIIMGTRTGDIDPGVLLYLARVHDLSPPQIARLVEREGGLMAVGHSADMQTLLARGGEDADAALAVDMFGYAVRKTIGAYAAALGGLDMLVFTGGIGEHAPLVRALSCQGLEHLGVTLDATANAQNAEAIGTGACAVRVMQTNENLVMARQALALVRDKADHPV